MVCPWGGLGDLDDARISRATDISVNTNHSVLIDVYVSDEDELSLMSDIDNTSYLFVDAGVIINISEVLITT